MGTNSKIEWTEATWNPVAGCSIISPGCTNCYAMRMAKRLDAMGQSKYKGLLRQSGGRPKWNGKVRLDEASLNVPRTWKQGRMIFVNSMSDLFHENVPLYFIERVFQVMRECRHHTFQVLTKRSERLLEITSSLQWSSNIWMGVSVENADYSYRIDDLRNCGAQTKFLSLEPLIGDVGTINLQNINWAIAGGESGPGARGMNPEWVRSIRDQCVASEVAFHFKQWGGVNKKKAGRLLDGRTWDELPTKAVA
jgi:protein gp37